MAKFYLKLLLVASMLWLPAIPGDAEESPSVSPDVERMQLFQRIETVTGIPWYYLAAVNQYEKNIRKPSKEKKEKENLISIDIASSKWGGFLNPNLEEKHTGAIEFFQGMGKDGSGDDVADRSDDVDILFTMANYLSEFGFTEDDIRIGLWEYYRQDKIVEIISEYAHIYKTFQTISLDDNTFPLPLHSTYSYRSTWGDARGWGGRRIHEGTDLFANYGTPVKSVCYGFVEVMGWNRYGGWRVGIRDLKNNYHYFAHLGGFNKQVKIGDVVKPGEVVGWVGSSGYGKPGTSGKFPPHLHYGIYKYNGRTEWAFDPYPHLKRWERNEWKKKKKR